jgi:hypothetical protein
MKADDEEAGYIFFFVILALALQYRTYPAVCMRRPRRAVTHTTECPAR